MAENLTPWLLEKTAQLPVWAPFSESTLSMIAVQCVQNSCLSPKYPNKGAVLLSGHLQTPVMVPEEHELRLPSSILLELAQQNRAAAQMLPG